MSGLLCDLINVGCDDDEETSPPAEESVSVGNPPARPPVSSSEESSTVARSITSSSRRSSTDETDGLETSSTRSNTASSVVRSSTRSLEESSTEEAESEASTPPRSLPTSAAPSSDSVSSEDSSLSNRNTTKSSETALGVGPIIGISVGGVAALIFLAWLLMFCCKKRRRNKDHEAIANWNSVEDFGGAGRSSSPAPLSTGRDSDSEHSAHKGSMSELSAAPLSVTSSRQPLNAFAPPPPPPASSFRGPMDRAPPQVYGAPFQPTPVHAPPFQSHVQVQAQPYPAPMTYVPNQQAGRTDYAFASAMMR